MADHEHISVTFMITWQTMKVSKSHIEQLTQALYQSEQLFEQDKDLIWLLRYEVRQKFPHALAKVLQSVKWNSFVDVAKVSNLVTEDPRVIVTVRSYNNLMIHMYSLLCYSLK